MQCQISFEQRMSQTIYNISVHFTPALFAPLQLWRENYFFMRRRNCSPWHCHCKSDSVKHCEMDVRDFNQVYECMEIPRRTCCLVFSLIAGDLPFTSLIVVSDLLLDRWHTAYQSSRFLKIMKSMSRGDNYLQLMKLWAGLVMVGMIEPAGKRVVRPTDWLL